MKIAFYIGLCEGYGAMEAGQYERLQAETVALNRSRREKDPSVPVYEPKEPLLIVDTTKLDPSSQAP